MRIREIDVHDDKEFHDFYAVMRDASLYQRPDAPMWSEREAQVMFRKEEPGETWKAFGAYDGGQLVGVAEFILPLLDNTDKAYFEVQVAPANRRHGIGSAVLSHVVEVAKANDRTVLLVEANVPMDERENHGYVRFARKHGFEPASVEMRRELRLPVSEEQLTAWEQEAAPHHTAYRIETFVDDLPEQLLESYCYLSNQLALDAPSGDIDFEPEGMTPEIFRVRQEKVKEQGRTVFETLAIDDSGVAVAQSTLVVPSDDPLTVHQWGTLVHREHRGHRLGLAVKARNLQAMQEAFPDRQRVVTWNSEENDHMLAINIKMGFEPVELMVEFQRKL